MHIIGRRQSFLRRVIWICRIRLVLVLSHQSKTSPKREITWLYKTERCRRLSWEVAAATMEVVYLILWELESSSTFMGVEDHTGSRPIRAHKNLEHLRWQSRIMRWKCFRRMILSQRSSINWGWRKSCLCQTRFKCLLSRETNTCTIQLINQYSLRTTAKKVIRAENRGLPVAVCPSHVLLGMRSRTMQCIVPSMTSKSKQSLCTIRLIVAIIYTRPIKALCSLLLQVVLTNQPKHPITITTK